MWYYVSHIILHKHLYYIHHKVRHDKLNYLHTNIGHVIEHIITPVGIIIPYLIMDVSYLDLCIAYIFVAFAGSCVMIIDVYG